MKFIKRNLKWIITIILVIIITTGISVYATTTYFANQVPYTTNKNAEISTVEDALNDLYKKISNNDRIVRKIVGSYSYNGDTNNGSKTFDVKNSIPNYKDLNEDNFVVNLNSIVAWGGSKNAENTSGSTVTKSYQDGILTVTIPRMVQSNGANPSVELSIIAYYIDNEID